MPPSGERKRLLADLPNYDLLWLHRATFSPLNVRPWRRAARRIIFDFDDAIMLSTHGLGLSRRIKFACTLRRCDAVTTASQYLAAHARKYCPCVEIVPMAVDIPDQGDRGGSAGSTQLLLRQDPLADPRLSPSLSGKTCSPTILWLGSKSTHRYLAEIAPALAQLARERPEARLRLVGHEPFAAGDLKVDFRRWSPQEQELALNECDIGLCPMPDTPWSRGKCPYKVLQYMAASMAWVGSAVGENLVCAGPADAPDPRGLCASTNAQWTAALVRLIDDDDLRRAIGAAGLAYVRRHHARQRLCERLVEIFCNVAGPSRA